METSTEANTELQNSNDIKEEVDSDDVEEILVGCDNISPKQCQKLQFSIAQIMGFEGKEASDRKVEFMKDEDREEPEQPVKLWRPLAQPPAAGSSASVTSGGISPASPGYPQHHQSPGFGESDHHHLPAPGPAALALLRHYTFFRWDKVNCNNSHSPVHHNVVVVQNLCVVTQEYLSSKLLLAP